ncbi:MAG: cytochrome P450 [Sphingomicrobium sp.]
MDSAPSVGSDAELSMFQLLVPSVHADPYPFYARLRAEGPVRWDPFMHTWVVSRYAEVQTVLQTFKADRTPSPAQLDAIGLPTMRPIAELMSRQMLFLDAPSHTGLRKLCSTALTPTRVGSLAPAIQQIAGELLDRVAESNEIDIIADFAEPFPAIVTARVLGVPSEDHRMLKAWSADFAELLGNFQHNPDRLLRMLSSVAELVAYFRAAIERLKRVPVDGLIVSLMNADVDGERLSEDDIIANAIITMVGGQETTTTLIGNGLLTLLRQPAQLALLRGNAALMKTAIEELLRFESPSQHTARIAPADVVLGGVEIPKGAAVMAIMASANRDPAQFPDPDRIDLARAENRHLAFGWAAHFCFGAPLARTRMLAGDCAVAGHADVIQRRDPATPVP